MSKRASIRLVLPLALMPVLSCASVPKAKPNLVKMEGLLENALVLAERPGSLRARIRVDAPALVDAQRRPVNLALIIDASVRWRESRSRTPEPRLLRCSTRWRIETA